MTDIDNNLSILEAKGIIADKNLYSNKLKSEHDTLKLLQEEKATLEI